MLQHCNFAKGWQSRRQRSGRTVPGPGIIPGRVVLTPCTQRTVGAQNRPEFCKSMVEGAYIRAVSGNS